MILWLVLLPFLALIPCRLMPRWREPVALGATAVNLVLALGVGVPVMRDGERLWGATGWLAWADVGLVADGLSTILLLTTAVTAMAVTIYAAYYFRVQPGREASSARVAGRFWLLWLVLLGGLNGLFLSTNLVALFLFLELIGGAAVGMVALGGSQMALAASMRYYFARLPGSLAFLFGVALLYGIYGSLDLRALGGLLEPSPLVAVAAALMVFGVVVKASLFPFHFWLPPAHSGAVGPAGAMLSGVVVKGPFYVFLRLWFDLFPDVATPTAAQCLGALGAIGIVWGAAQALRSEQLKLVIAYSTVSQMGFLVLLFPLLTGPIGTAWASAAWTGGLYQVMSHAMAKASLLMAAGIVLYAIGSDKLSDMDGMARRLPVTTLAMALSCVTLIGLPPSGGFIAKWLLLTATIESGQWWWIPPLLGGGLLTAAYAFRLLSYAFRTGGRVPPMRPVPLGMEMMTLSLALVAILIGLRVQEPMRLIEPIAEPAGMGEEVGHE